MFLYSVLRNPTADWILLFTAMFDVCPQLRSPSFQVELRMEMIFQSILAILPAFPNSHLEINKGISKWAFYGKISEMAELFSIHVFYVNINVAFTEQKTRNS